MKNKRNTRRTAKRATSRKPKSIKSKKSKKSKKFRKFCGLFAIVTRAHRDEAHVYRTTHVQGEVVVFALVQLGDKFLPYQVRFVHKRTLELAGRLRPGMKLILETGCFGYRRGRQDKELRVKRFSLAATNQIQPRLRNRSLRRKRIDCIGWLPKPSRRNKSRRIRFPIALDRARLREPQPTDAAWFNTFLQGAFSDNVAECRGNLSFLVSQYSGGVAPNWSLDSFVRSGEEGGVETYDGEKHDA